MSRGLLLVLALTAACVLGSCSDLSGQHSDKPTVVVLILDEFPTDDLLRPDGTIDAERFPNFARLAGLSTWFPNAHTVFDQTFKAVPAILDARLPVDHGGATWRSHDPSVFTLMDELGYDIDAVESASSICPPEVCADASRDRPGILPQLAGGNRPAKLRHWIEGIRAGDPAFHLHHALLPHEPWLYLPSGRASRPAGHDPIPKINKPWGFDDLSLSHHNHARHLLQVGFVDHEIGRLLDRLRTERMLRRTLLVVVADHGYSFDTGVDSRRWTDERNIDEIAPVPFFFKAPGQIRGRVDHNLVRNIDLVPTLAEALGAEVEWRHAGRSAFSSASRRRRDVAVIERDFSRVIRVDGQNWKRRREANRERWARLFGTGEEDLRRFGDPWAGVLRVDADPRLLGRRVAALATAAAPRGPELRPDITEEQELDRVRPRASMVPTRVAGELLGAPRRGIRKLAVAVNGRIRAAGESFRLGHRPHEYFSFLLPESSLRRGRNDVRLYEVLPGNRLIPLQGAER